MSKKYFSSFDKYIHSNDAIAFKCMTCVKHTFSTLGQSIFPWNTGISLFLICNLCVQLHSIDVNISIKTNP